MGQKMTLWDAKERVSMESVARNRSYSGPLRAVVLDWAGTAVDYGCMGPVGAFVEMFDREGVSVTAKEAREPMGLRKIDHLRAMCRMDTVLERWRQRKGEGISEEDIRRMYASLEPLMVETIVRYSDPVPGLLEFVSHCRARGIRIGSSTGYTRPIMEVLTVEAGRRGYQPDCVVTSSDVPQGRPAPFMCYRNAVELEVYPMAAMVKIGDTVSDIQEGLNAGMWTVALTKSGSDLGLSQKEVEFLSTEELDARLEAIASRFRAEGAHYVVEDIGQCRDVLEAIHTRLASGERP